MSKERYAEHTVAWELPNGDSVTKSNYNLANIETKYLPIQTEVVSDNKDRTIDELKQRIAELENLLSVERVVKAEKSKQLEKATHDRDRYKNKIAELEQENESYQKLINDICNKHRVGSLKDLDEIYQATNESLYASREYLEELKSAKWELEEQLKNAIVPKFKVGQDLYIIDEFDYSIVPFEIDKILITENGVEIKSVEWEEWFTEDEFFITREEALVKLEELQGERNGNK